MARLQSSRTELEFEICDYCGTRTQDAEFLPCTHVVCVVCFEEAVTRDSRTGCMVCDYDNHHDDDGTVTIEGEIIMCGLCTDEVEAVAHCEHCSLDVCEFCAQAHTRQRQTSSHTLISLSPSQSSPPSEAIHTVKISSDPLPSCSHEESSNSMRFYCEDCYIVVCSSCKQSAHSDHQLIGMNDMGAHCFERLQNLLSKTQPLILTLKESVVTIENLQDNVHQNSLRIGNDVCHIIDNHIAALHEHRTYLLNELDRIKHHKLHALSLQLDSLTNALKDIHEVCNLTSQVLSPSYDSPDPIPAKLSLARQLEELINTRYEYKPQQDDYIHFVPKASAGIKRGFEMNGILDIQTPSLVHSFINNDNFVEAKQRRVTSLKLVLVDKNGSLKLNGGDRVDMRVQTNSGTLVKTRVIDKEDGSYELLFTPDVPGGHRVSVTLMGKHIKGSPFLIQVRPRKKHHGVFHCCTFCSTRGKMHVPCGCGAKIPGGYSGCGHGHEGHPGCHHWSCCGNTEENSDCTV